MTNIIYDFETLGQNPDSAPVVSFAILEYDPEKFLTDPYEFYQLVNDALFIKFNVKEQIQTYNRIAEKDTINWWKDQSKEAQKGLIPNENDLSIAAFKDILLGNFQCHKVKHVFTRGNTFDPIFLKSILGCSNQEDPFPWWTIRDTRSFIEGLSYGSDIDNRFIPDGLTDAMIAHDPVHDIAMDVMRMQYLIRTLFS